MARPVRRALRWWRLPIWVAELFTGAKSFCDNPILGSRRLNSAGLHVLRLKTAHALARQRRSRLTRQLPSALREQFNRDGFVEIRDFLPPEKFRDLRVGLATTDLETRVHQQGDTITRRAAVSPELQQAVPVLREILDDPTWKSLMAYVASTSSRPLYYLQEILGGVAQGPPDPQLQLHSDTFHPSMKAWLFLEDVPEDGRPLTYVAGSHRLSPKRIEWERQKSIHVLQHGDRLSQRGSFRITPDELTTLGLPAPTRFAVPANTLVIVDTCGFHARADSDRPTQRVELWAYCRRSPFVPWSRAGVFSSAWLGDQRTGWLYAATDLLDRLGLRRQHWSPAGPGRLLDRPAN